MLIGEHASSIVIWKRMSYFKSGRGFREEREKPESVEDERKDPLGYLREGLFLGAR